MHIDDVSLWSSKWNVGRLTTKLSGMETDILGFWDFNAVMSRLQVPNIAATTNSYLDGEIRVLQFPRRHRGGTLFVGSSSLRPPDQVQVSGTYQLLELRVVPNRQCESQVFTITQFNGPGQLFEALQTTNGGYLNSVVRGAALAIPAIVNTSTIYFLAPVSLSTSSLSYAASCDGFDSVNIARIVINSQPKQLCPHLALESRISLSADILRIEDPDEMEYNSVATFSTTVKSALSSPSVVFPPSEMAISVSTASLLEANETFNAVTIRGSATASELNTFFNGVTTTVNNANPFSAQYDVKLEDAKIATVYTVDHRLGNLPVILSVSPPNIFLNGTLVQIYGLNFWEGIICDFNLGNQTVPATFVSRTHVQCETPKLANDHHLLLLSLYRTGLLEFNSNTINLVVIPPFQLRSLHPENRIVHIGSEVVVEGASTWSGRDILCRLTNKVVEPHGITQNGLACRIPYFEMNSNTVLQTIDLFVSQNKVDYVPIGPLQLARRPVISRIYPSSGFISQAIHVDVFGSNFFNFSDLVCKVGTMLMAAEFVSDSQVRCAIRAPVNGSALIVPVEISINGIDFSSSMKKFTFMSDPVVLSILPSNGLVTGGAVVQVAVSDLLEDLDYTCCFGEVEVDAFFISQHRIDCKVPHSDHDGAIMFSVKITGLPKFDKSVLFTYMPIPVVDRVFPAIGVVNANLLLTLFGRNFRYSKTLSCVFTMGSQEWRTSIAFVSESILQCNTPAIERRGKCTVHVAISDQDAHNVTSNASYIFHDEIALYNSSMAAGPTTGGSEVILHGGPFYPSPELTCKFGNAVTNAQFISTDVVKCFSPVWDSAITPTISLSMNGVQYSSASLPFQYYAPPLISSVNPMTAPTNELLQVWVQGPYFSRLSKITCRVGKHFVNGTVVTSTRVLCEPCQSPSEAGIVDVEISLNGLDFTHSQHHILIHEPIQLIDAEPLMVAQGTNTTIHVSGSGFLATSDLVCLFGSGFQSKADYISSDMVRCLFQSIAQTGSVELRLSLNGIHTSSSSLFIHVFELPRFDGVLSRQNGSDRFGEVTVSGAAFLMSGTPVVRHCIFGDAEPTLAIVEDMSVIHCNAPDIGFLLKEIIVPLSFQLITMDVVSTSLQFRYIASVIYTSRNTSVFVESASNESLETCSLPREPALSLGHLDSFTVMATPVLISISPKIMTVNQKVNVTIHGQNLQRNGTFCHFSSQNESLLAKVTSASSAICEFTAPSTNGTVQMKLSGTAVGTGGSMLELMVISNLTITKLNPARGAFEGNNTIFVTGEGYLFSEELYCVFGEIIVPAVPIDKETVACRSPPSRQSNVSVQIAMSQGHAVSNQLLFSYYAAPRLSWMSPSYGRVQGNSQVVIYGSGFNGSDNIFCDFGGRGVNAVVFNSSAIICMTPPSASAASFVSLSCSANGIEIDSPEILFQYIAPFHISNISPQFGFASSNSSVTLYGHGFLNDLSVRCWFGNATSWPKLHSSTEIRCIAPPHEPGIVPVTLAVDINDNLEAVAVHFQYIGACVLSEI